MNPLRIGIDFDGVLADHRLHKLRLAKEHGFALDAWQTNSNVMRNFLPLEAYESVRTILYGDMTHEAPPVAGALEAVARLPGELYVITARRRPSVPALEWMKKHGVAERIPPERVRFCGNKESKNTTCLELGIDLFIDDQLSLLEILPQSVTKVLFDNDGIAAKLSVPGDIRVVGTWEEFSLLATKLANEKV
ncbi:MAG: hypothetical protein WC866_01395 [Patescibacteria group bacterium]|jgi:hypothetical protein